MALSVQNLPLQSTLSSRTTTVDLGSIPGHRVPIDFFEDGHKMSFNFLQGGKRTLTGFLIETSLMAIPMGVEKLIGDIVEHPGIVVGIAGFVVGVAFLPEIVATRILYASAIFSVGLLAKSAFTAYQAFEKEDRQQEEAAVTDIGVASISLIMMAVFSPSGSATVASKQSTANPFSKNFKRAFAALSHSSDEIAAGLPVVNGLWRYVFKSAHAASE